MTARPPAAAAVPQRQGSAGGLVLLALTAMTAAGYHLGNFGFPIVDAFHYGEYLAAPVTVMQGAPYDGHPYTIHGMADILPAYALDRLGLPRDHLIAATGAIFQALEVAAALFAILAALRFAAIFGISPVVLAPFAVYAGFSVGWRDVVLLAGLWMFAATLRISGKASERRIGLQIGYGALTAFGLYWSFNRGIPMVTALALPLLLLWYLRGGLLPAILSFIGFALLFGAILPGMSLLHYLENFRLLLETSSKWQKPLEAWHLRWAAALLALNGGALGLTIWFVLRRRPPVGQIAILLALGILAAFYTKIGLARIDTMHLNMALWAPLLLISLVAGATTGEPPRPARWMIGVGAGAGLVVFGLALSNALRFPIVSILVLAATVIAPARLKGLGLVMAGFLALGGFALLSLNSAKLGEAGAYGWLGRLAQLPPTEEAVTPDMLWLGERLEHHGAACVFSMVNAGMIHAVTSLPSCSQFTYLVYAGPEHEERLIGDLEATRPAAIVYSADPTSLDYFNYSFDGLTMAELFPRLDAELRERYPQEECKFGYCLRH